MQKEPPELTVAKAMRDYARSLRSLAIDSETARVALDQEVKFAQQVDELEADAVQPELPLNGEHSDAA